MRCWIWKRPAFGLSRPMNPLCAGLTLRRGEREKYLQWAVDCFRLAGVSDETQHSYCYCEFNDIMPSMTALDADVISIETSRSNMELLKSSPHPSTQMTSARAFMLSIRRAARVWRT